MHDVELVNGFSYHAESELVEAKFITISGYSMKHMDKVAPIKEIVMKAMSHFGKSLDSEVVADANEKAESKQSDKSESKAEIINGKEMMSIIYMHCDKGDMSKLFAYMGKLLSAGICSIDGETPFRGNHIEDMHPNDYEKLCGEYIGNFITS